MMTGASARRINGPVRTLALLLLVTLTRGGVAAQEDEVYTGEGEVTAEEAAMVNADPIRGDMIADTSEEPALATPQVQIFVWPDPHFTNPTYAPDVMDIGEEKDLTTPVAPEGEGKVEPAAEVEHHRGDGGEDDLPQTQTQAPMIPHTSQASGGVLLPEADVMCVNKEKVQDKDAVSLTLKTSSSCEETRLKIESVLEHLCGPDCKLEVYQEDNTNQILISGPYIDEDAKGMAEKFNNDNIKDKIDVEDAVPRWGKNSRVVLVSLLLAGLLLAALLVAGYYLKTHRGNNAKGVRLAESFQVDEENQANTLVSVAPLQPQEPVDKPTVNGESSPDDGRSQSTPTNGHSATQTPVADTQM
ncbi:hematopoietic progenitor cell antigen CD34-like [Hypomesus transpacificus]|uniref:hematopoietic progenitor cell antigen CD34-like n=1 Tax=Hypomesus transpacificus TaxID=137520 RepID=UPI001F07C03E|nr:hematopoietic progenitor cell antigen CD34-like [Hypomesus transpacificus]